MNAAPELLRRPTIPELDLILGKVFPVLDQGFIRVIDYMGGEDAICQAARVSYGAGTKKKSDDRALLRTLLRNRHTSPFEMANIKFHVRMPMDAWRQGVRHRMAKVSEYSTRYSLAIDDKQETAADQWRLQNPKDKQGSDGYLDPAVGAALSARELAFHEEAQSVYEERITAGVAREQARKDLPLSTYTEFYWSWDLHNLLHFLGLRMDHHAQLEIRAYADVIGKEIVAKWCPNIWEAFMDYRFEAVSLSRQEQHMALLLGQGQPSAAMDFAHAQGWLRKDSRERAEIEAKWGKLGWMVPWQPANLE